MQRRILSFLWLLLAAATTAGGACEPNIPGDLTGDCHVDFNDFTLMASDWLQFGTDEPNQEWVARYNGPYDGSDIAGALAIDSNDNVYVTGSSSYLSGTDIDCATIKYSPDSNQPVWVARYNGPSNGSDFARAIAVDSNDNIYVAGRSYYPGTDYDYATIKYSPDSNQPVWVARYNGPGNGPDEARAIVVDSNDNIYVTGYSMGSGTDDDYATIKYSPDSNQPVWVARYNGPGNDLDWATAIAVDSNDNIYVTGISTSSGTDYDYATIKYSPDSNEAVWVARYNGPGNDTDSAEAIAIDSNDNIYVVGRSIGSGTNYDYATIKYASESNEPIWIARYNDSNGQDSAKAIAVDSNDNIYVTGSSMGSVTKGDYATIKYSSDSNEAVWVARYNGPGDAGDYIEAIAIDRNDNIYVTGWSTGSGTGYDYATVKYSPDSNQPVWVARYNGPGNDTDRAYDIAVDSNDNIYVTGESFGSGTGGDYATIKYSPEYSCTPQVTGDFDHDCDVDIYDLRTFCQQWLECNLDPPEACWE